LSIDCAITLISAFLSRPLWPEIFAQDSERKQSFEEAVATYEVMVDTYAALGYELIQLP